MSLIQKDSVTSTSGDRSSPKGRRYDFSLRSTRSISRDHSRDREYGREGDHKRYKRYRRSDRSPSYRGRSYRKYSRSRSDSDENRGRRHRSPARYQKDNRDKPEPSRVLGLFGLNKRTTKREIREILSGFSLVEKIDLIVDRITKESRGFAFAYFRDVEDARIAKENCVDLTIDGCCVRVDYSLTERAHTPTPGVYMGITKRKFQDRSGHCQKKNRRFDYRRRSPYSRRRSYNERSRSRSYTPRRR